MYTGYTFPMAKSRAKSKEDEDSKILYAIYLLALTGVLALAGLVFTNAPPYYTFLGLLILMQVIAQTIQVVYQVHLSQN